MRTRLLVAGLAVASLALAACGGAAPTGSGPPSPEGMASEPTAPHASETQGSEPVATGEPEPAPEALAALDFQARAVGGGAIDATTYAGSKTVLWIWAPWCPQCNREAPNVNAAIARFGDDLHVIGIAGKDTDAEHEEFVARHDLGAIPHAIDDDGSLWAKYGVGYQPAWVFIAEDGTTRVVAGGLYDDLEPTLEDFLNS
jgi:peroxiredoxin